MFQGNLSTFVWSIANNGLTNTNVNALYLNGTDLYAGTNAGVFNTPISNISWAPTGTFTDTINSLTVYGNNLLAGTRNQGVQKSTISAYTWAASHAGFNNLKSFAGAAKDSTVAVANEQGVFVCKNFVASAVYVKSNNGLADSLHVTAMQFNAAHTLYAGTKNAGVFVTTDSGATWVSANAGLTSLSVVKLLATATKLYAATSDGKVFSTLQSNLSWTEVSNNLPANLIVTSIAGAGGDTILVGATTGVYGSIGGANWFNTGLNQSVTAVTFKDGFVYAGTDTAGVFKTLLTNPAWVAVNTNLPTLKIQALYTSDVFVVVGYKGGAKASCNAGKTWRDFGILEYIPNYSNILGFTDITPRIFAITEEHGLLGNSKNEFPEAAPDSITTITGPAVVCAGGATAYSVVNDIEANSYTWNFPSSWTGITPNNNLAAATVDTTSGNVTVTASNGCGSVSKTLAVTVAPIPVVTLALPQSTICDNASPLTLTGGTPSGGTYSGPGVSGGNFDPSQASVGNMVIAYSYTSPAGCTSGNSDNITVTTCTGINEVTESGLQVYPNPFSNQLTVKTNGIAGSYIVVNDVTGKTVATVNVTGANTIINTASFANGIYTVSVIENSPKVAAAKLVKAD